MRIPSGVKQLLLTDENNHLFFLSVTLLTIMVSCAPGDEKIATAVKTALSANPALSLV